MKTRHLLIILFSLFILSMILLSCEKTDEIDTPIQLVDSTYCWSCETTILTQVKWVDGTHIRLGYPSTTTYTRNICNATNEDIYLYELSGSDSVDIDDGSVFVTVIKNTKCSKSIINH